MKTQTYYQQMKKYVDQVVKYYREDFTIYDRDILRQKPDEFLWAIRDTGTSLCRLDDYTWDYKTMSDIDEIAGTIKAIILGALDNERFFHARDGLLIEVSKKQVQGIIIEHAEKHKAILQKQLNEEKRRKEEFEAMLKRGREAMAL